MLLSPFARYPAPFIGAAINLLEEMRHRSDERRDQPDQEQKNRKRLPKRSIRRQTRLKARRNKRHAAGNQREQSERGGESVEVAGHGGPVLILPLNQT